MKWRNITLVGACIPALMMALVFTAPEEGIELKVYLDAANVPTYCRGETENPEWGKLYTETECDQKFVERMNMFAVEVDRAVKPPMKPEFHAALTSWSYNVGLNAMRKSTLIKKANAGDMRGACDELLRWKYAGGKPILLKRRERERALCMKGI